jgi:hypothetical protein
MIFINPTRFISITSLKPIGLNSFYSYLGVRDKFPSNAKQINSGPKKSFVMFDQAPARSVLAQTDSAGAFLL